jgi:hypothetical protein
MVESCPGGKTFFLSVLKCAVYDVQIYDLSEFIFSIRAGNFLFPSWKWEVFNQIVFILLLFNFLIQLSIFKYTF